MNNYLKVIPKEEILKLVNFINDIEDDFTKKCTGSKNISYEIEKMFAINALMNNKTLADCAKSNMNSLKFSFLRCASTGISLNPSYGLANLIVRTVNHEPAVVFELTYKGIIYLATRKFNVRSVVADVVREGDTFIQHGKTQLPEHSYDPFENKREEKNIKGVYGIACFRDGGVSVDWMSEHDVLERRPEYVKPSHTNSAWNKWKEEMFKKTVIKRLFKLIPCFDPEISAILNNEYNEDYSNQDNEYKKPHSQSREVMNRLKGSLPPIKNEEDSFLKELKEADRLEEDKKHNQNIVGVKP